MNGKIVNFEKFKQKKLDYETLFSKEMFESIFGEKWGYSLETDRDDGFIIHQILTYDQMILIRDSIQKFGSANIKNASGTEARIINIFCPMYDRMLCLTDF